MNKKTLIALFSSVLLALFAAVSSAPAFADYNSGKGNKNGHSKHPDGNGSKGKGKAKGHANKTPGMAVMATTAAMEMTAVMEVMTATWVLSPTVVQPHSQAHIQFL